MHSVYVYRMKEKKTIFKPAKVIPTKGLKIVFSSFIPATMVLDLTAHLILKNDGCAEE